MIRDELELEEVVGAYERGGAAALSVLTEQARFRRLARRICAGRARRAALPILRKDFIVDRLPGVEALRRRRRRDPADRRRAGTAAGSRALHALAARLGLGVLVEVHDARELEVARAIGARDRSASTTATWPRSRSTPRAPSSCCREVPGGTVIVSPSPGFATPRASSTAGRRRRRRRAGRRGADALRRHRGGCRADGRVGAQRGAAVRGASARRQSAP